MSLRADFTDVKNAEEAAGKNLFLGQQPAKPRGFVFNRSGSKRSAATRSLE
jgi:hypothetical protein